VRFFVSNGPLRPLGECYATNDRLQSGSTLHIQIELGNTGKFNSEGVHRIV
jgi:hypothetical protein